MSARITFKYIEVRGAGKSPSGKTLRFTVHARKSGDQLGVIQWRAEWRCYCFEPCFPTVFEHVCLRDIADLLETQTAVHKATGGVPGLAKALAESADHTPHDVLPTPRKRRK